MTGSARIVEIGLRPRLAWLLPALLALGGCVSFEFPPTTSPLGCDPALVGTWGSIVPGVATKAADDTTADGLPSEWRVLEDCRVDLSKVREYDPGAGFDLSSFKTFELDGYRYMTFEARRHMRNFDENYGFIEEWPKHRVLLLRYEIEGETLVLWLADFDAAAAVHSRGVRRHERGLFYRTGEEEDNEFSAGSYSERYFSGNPGDLENFLHTHGDRIFVAPHGSMRRVPRNSAP
jgi:hypothetical protein